MKISTIGNERIEDLLINEALKYAKRKVVENPVGSNRGLEIDYWIREAGLDPKLALPWCAVFVSQIAVQTFGKAWPFVYSASVQQLATLALTQKVLKDEGQRGDLFVLWFDTLQPARYGHIGIVQTVSQNLSMLTVEGNAAPTSGTREGYGVFEKTRDIGPKTKFIRWLDLI